MQFKPYLPVALALGLAMTAAQAAPPAGQLLASQCAQCHGTNGNGPGFDKLAGSSAREIANEMLEMKYRSTPEGIMGRQSHGYTDAQIQLIADYLSGQTGSAGGGTGGSTGGGTGSAGSDGNGDNKAKEKKPTEAKKEAEAKKAADAKKAAEAKKAADAKKAAAAKASKARHN